MTQYQATRQLHETVKFKAKELGLKVEIESDFMIGETSQLYQNAEFINGGMTSDLLPAIQEPQLKQIFVAFAEKLGGLNIEIKECGNGFYALLNNNFLFCLKKNVGFTGYKRVFFKSKNKNETYKNFLQNDTFGLEKRIFSTKKELETELNKYYLDEEDFESAEALYQKYCYDYPESAFKKDPVKVLLEVNEIIKSL